MTILNFLMGLFEGPVMFAQDLGWFLLAAFGPALLCHGALEAYGPNSMLRHPWRARAISLGLWVLLLFAYDRASLIVQKWMMRGSILCWVISIVIVLIILYLVFRDERKKDKEEAWI